ncbi:hypothetical protein FB451DRAFT_1223672 [Mycena latifolia]|nr:hypothetical protein FB451DRAFT_1223672 [Mycena latifolia]
MSSNMPDDSSAFPLELEREMFETAARLHPETIPALLRVAHRVLICVIEPLLYRTLVITHRGQLEAVLQKSSSFLRENVRNLMVWMERNEDMSPLLSICTGIQELVYPPLQLFGFLGPLHLRRLTLPISRLFYARALILPTSPFLADLTHLHIHSQRNLLYHLLVIMRSSSVLCE